LSETVTRLRAAEAGTDRRGNAEPGEPTRLDIDGCAVAPRGQGENRTEGRQAVTSGWTVYAPTGADVLATDQVEVRGVVYEVDGEPADWRSPFSGRRPGLVFDVVRVEG